MWSAVCYVYIVQFRNILPMFGFDGVTDVTLVCALICYVHSFYTCQLFWSTFVAGCSTNSLILMRIQGHPLVRCTKDILVFFVSPVLLCD
jgi:hypothetical protein